MGVTKEVLKPGREGVRPKSGDRVTVHYVCRLAGSGTIVDSSKLKGRAAEFQVGMGKVIQGWDVGIMDMDECEEATLHVSSDFAYGTSGRPPSIPPNTDLQFHVELLAINESMVAAAHRAKSEALALAHEEEMVRAAREDMRREGGGPGLRTDRGERQRDDAKRDEKKRKKSKSKHSGRSERDRHDPDSESGSRSDHEDRRARKRSKHRKSDKSDRDRHGKRPKHFGKHEKEKDKRHKHKSDHR